MKYDYNVSSHRRRRFIKRTYILIVAILLVIIAVGVGIRIDAYLEKDRNNSDSTTSSQTTGYFAPSSQIFRTKYFQIQTNNNWAEVPAESSDKKFVYRSLRNNLVEHDMTIYVEDIPANLAATRVLPAKFTNDLSELEPGSVSEHCIGKDQSNPTAADQVVVVNRVSMLCDLDNTQYIVIVGQQGADTILKMKRPDGNAVDYSIVYRNVTAKPDAQQLYDIISSFQTR